MLGGAFILKKFVSKIAQSGFYIILFLCISAIAISAYVMYLARDTADTIKNDIDLESSLELPFPSQEKTVYDFGTGIQLPEENMPKNESENYIENEVPQEKETEKIPAKKDTEKKTDQKAEPTISIPKEPEKVVYTMAVSGAISAPFSGEELVKSKTMGDWRIHAGVDIKGDIGTDVRAIADGTVKSVETDSMMGNTIRIAHSGGIESIYANLADGMELKVGDSVKNGDIIGKIGQSALCECLEEAHLHLEILKNGKNIDPLSLFPAGEE